jgi:hypothetical protein
MLPGTLQLGDTLLIEGELCLANQQQVQHPTLRAIQASARLHAWDDRRLLAIWDPHVGCFVRVTTNATSPNAASAECMPLACAASATSCAALGMLGLCGDPESMWARAVRNSSDVAAAALIARLSVSEAAEAVQRLCEPPLRGDAAPLHHGSARHVWRTERTRAGQAWRASELVVASHVHSQLHSVRVERLPKLGGLVGSVLESWRDGEALIEALGAWADALLKLCINLTTRDDVDDAGLVPEPSTRPEWGVLLSALGFGAPPSVPPLAAPSLELAQLAVEVAAQLAAAELWLHASNATHHLHSLLSEGCATDTEIASLMTHQLEAMNSSLQAWRTALEPLSPRSGELEASGGASATRQMPYRRIPL